MTQLENEAMKMNTWYNDATTNFETFRESEAESVNHPCSLCGRDSGIEQGAIDAEWYLCEDCEGTAAAVAAGFTH